uniref:C2H2-type domain-containing protein n=1 Tax=Timema tahoe TaxID=61484 RepID=A0A7R9NXY9_9NEOP|nr:unnamed protein product [Timema tahoe]
MAHSGIQQQRHPQQNHHCKDCGLYFDSVKSLDVHLHYHKENLLSKWASQTQATGDESNNNSHKTGNNNAKNRVSEFSNSVMAPADSSESMLKSGDTTGSGAPGRPPSTSSTIYNRGSPPVSASFTHPPTPGSYSSAPSPYQSENHRFSPAGVPQHPSSNFSYANSNNRNERTPPPQNAATNQFHNFAGGASNFTGIVDQLRSPRIESTNFFSDTQIGSRQEDSSFILGSGVDFPSALRSSTPSTISSPSPSPTITTSTPSTFRYHPYHNIPVSHHSQQNLAFLHNDHRNIINSSPKFTQSPSSQTPLQCEKCGFVCNSTAVLLEHISIAHAPTNTQLMNNQQAYLQHQNHMIMSQRLGHGFQPPPNQHQQQHRNPQGPMPGMFPNFNDPGGTDIGNQLLTQIKQEDETPAEILDLDSHKVHVYQPPEEEEALRAAVEAENEGGRSSNQNPHSVSAMLWGNTASPSSHKPFQPRGNMVESSPPEFNNVAPSLVHPPPNGMIVPQPTTYQHHRSYLPQSDHLSSNPEHSAVSPPHQSLITSSQLPNPNPVSSSLPSGNQQMPVQPQQPQQQSQKGNQSWKSNEARRPKTYNCSACNKWFTSSGHLKRHYNTTLHKNAVKQSGSTDPASLPISQHHHPAREPSGTGNIVQRVTPVPSCGGDSSSPSPSLGGEDSSRSDDANQSNNSFGRITPQHPHSSNMLPSSNSQIPGSPPNRLAGPSAEISGGLHFLSTYNTNSSQDPISVRSSSEVLSQQTLPPHHHLMLNAGSPHTQPLIPPPPSLGPHLIHHPIPQQPGMQRYPNTPPSTTAFPNGLPPHVSTTQTLISTNQHHLTTTIGSSNGSPALPSAANLDEMPQSHLFLSGSPGGFYQPSSMPVSHHPLPSFTQLHQGHLFGSNNGNPVAMLPGFSGMSQYHQSPGYHLVSTFENVGGLMFSPNNNHIMDDHYSFLNAENDCFYPYSNGVFEEDIKLLRPEELGKSDDTLGTNMVILSDTIEELSSPITDCVSVIPESSDMSGNVGDEISNISSVGTPDCPTSTTEDFEYDSIQINNLKPNDKKTNMLRVTESNHDDTLVTEVIPLPNGQVQHKCVTCDKVFNKVCYLTQHNKSFHSGHKPFKCNRCGKRFPSEFMHSEHLSKHAGEKPFKCEICPKQFNHKTDLRRHICLHTGEKPYSCQVCGLLPLYIYLSRTQCHQHHAAYAYSTTPLRLRRTTPRSCSQARPDTLSERSCHSFPRRNQTRLRKL